MMTNTETIAYICDDGNAPLTIHAASAEAAAQEYVDGGDWITGGQPPRKTDWVTVYTYPAWIDGLQAKADNLDDDPNADEDEVIAALDAAEDAMMEHREFFTVEIEPVEYDCLDGEDHDWRSPHALVGGCESNPGVWGHGGGVIIAEVCVICGGGRVTNTWAQNRATGEQGLRSTEYVEEECDIESHLSGLDVDLDAEILGEGETWSVRLVEGPWGWWGVVVHEDGVGVGTEWHRSEADARDEGKDMAEWLTTVD